MTPLFLDFFLGKICVDIIQNFVETLKTCSDIPDVPIGKRLFGRKESDG